MREASKRSSVWEDTRWADFTSTERHLVHHALRMLAKFPSEKEAASKLADEVWDLHCTDVWRPTGECPEC